MNERKSRIVLYSHDTMGIGHMRRNMLLARALAGQPLGMNTLLITGARESTMFMMPPGVDCLALPAIRKEGSGNYRPRYLDVSLRDLIALRSHTISAAIETFNPDAFIVDKVPRGAIRELEPALAMLRRKGFCRCILGLRDVLDEPDIVRQEWEADANEDAIRDYYDSIWVYGDPLVYDPAREYGFSAEVVAKIHYTGYLNRRQDSILAVDGAADMAIAPPAGPYVLCLVGGGQDGSCLAESFAHAELPPGLSGVLVMGPFMPSEVQQRLLARAEVEPRLRVLQFVPDTDPLLSRAERIIAMGGYNTVCEILSYQKIALIVPRVRPRREQMIRAERLHALGALEVLHPDAVSPAALSDWLSRQATSSRSAIDRIDFQGLTRLPMLLRELLDSPRLFKPRRQTIEQNHERAAS